MIRNTQYRCI